MRLKHATAAVAAAMVALTLACGSPGNEKKIDRATPGASQPPEQSTPESTVTPSPSDFRITIKVLSKQCFGDAGCNLSYRITPAYGGPKLPEDKEWSVTYDVIGGESGPQTNTFTLRGEKVEYTSEEFISTRNNATKLTAKVTQVLEN